MVITAINTGISAQLKGKNKRLYVPILETSSPLNLSAWRVNLSLSNSEYFCTAGRADALGRRLAILHGYGLGILDFFLDTALHAVCLHLMTLLV